LQIGDPIRPGPIGELHCHFDRSGEIPLHECEILRLVMLAQDDEVFNSFYLHMGLIYPLWYVSNIINFAFYTLWGYGMCGILLRLKTHLEEFRSDLIQI